MVPQSNQTGYTTVIQSGLPDGNDPSLEFMHREHQGPNSALTSSAPLQQPSMSSASGDLPQSANTWHATVAQSGVPLGPVLQQTQSTEPLESGSLRLQLITGDWITVSAAPAALASPIPEKCWPMGQGQHPQVSSRHHANFSQLTQLSPTQQNGVTPDAPSTTTGSGIDPGGDWDDLDEPVEITLEDTHTLTLSQREHVFTYNKQLVRQ